MLPTVAAFQSARVRSSRTRYRPPPARLPSRPGPAVWDHRTPHIDPILDSRLSLDKSTVHMVQGRGCLSPSLLAALVSSMNWPHRLMVVFFFLP